MTGPLRTTARSRAISGLLALCLGAFGVVGALVAAPTTASAQSNVVVLGIRSLEGDDEFARNLTGAIRHAASRIDGWNISDREVTLAQMALAHGCAEPDVACMANIASALSASHVIYGDVRRTSAGDDFDFSLNLRIFDSSTGQDQHSVAETIPGVRRDIDDLREPARRFVAALSGAPRTGTLSVLVNVPGAEVFVDDTSVGQADGEGHLMVSDIPAGTRNVRIVAEGHQSFRSTVTIEAYGEATFEAELTEGSGGGGGSLPTLAIVGGALTALAAVAAGVWIGGYVHIHTGIGAGANQENGTRRMDWGDARARYPAEAGPDGNFCRAHRDPATRVEGLDWIDDLCDEYDTWLPLQIGAGVVAGVLAAIGVPMLIVGLLEDGDDAEQATIRLLPNLSPTEYGLTVAGTF